jgi:UDP-N-acetylglucosamine 2-epimerase (non-hydrolysing)
MLIKLEEVIKHIKPDIVLVYGDTNSTLAGALASVKHHIPVGHVEAGYRSFDMSMPEEINRIITDSISQLLFAFTEGSVRNLLREGVNREKIIFSGNLKVETVLRNISKARQSTILEKIDVKPGEYALLTIHRQENADYIMRIKKIFLGLVKSPLPIIFPVHPRTKKVILNSKEILSTLKKTTIMLIEPLPYLDFLKLESEASFILTDSGGVQVEALVLNKPCITLRYNTEHIETIEAGCNVLVGTEQERIEKEIVNAMKKSKSNLNFALPPRWDINVSERIVDGIETKIGEAKEELAVKNKFSNLTVGYKE